MEIPGVVLEVGQVDPLVGRGDVGVQEQHAAHVADVAELDLAVGLRGLPRVIEERTGLSVRVADDPLTCVARGTAIYLENLEEWKGTMDSDVDDG